MVPTPDMSGMKLERLASDSVLARVGVAQGDVISAINGVSITNVADASNAPELAHGQARASTLQCCAAESPSSCAIR